MKIRFMTSGGSIIAEYNGPDRHVDAAKAVVGGIMAASEKSGGNLEAYEGVYYTGNGAMLHEKTGIGLVSIAACGMFVTFGLK